MASTQADRSTATRAKLVKAARGLFMKRPYSEVGTEEIVRRARVTRGALYHHFKDKRALFRAVHEQIEQELVESIAAEFARVAPSDPLDGLMVGMRSFLDACNDPDFARVILVDAPAVLGWEEWRRIDEQYALPLTIATLEAAMEAGVLRRQPVRPLAQLVMAAMQEAGLVIANAEDPVSTRRELEGALLAWLDGLRL